RVIGLCGDEFFHNFVEHDKVTVTYKNWEAAVNLRGDPRLPFEYGGISWVRYHSRPKTKTARTGIVAGGKMIGDNECRFVPMGVQELFITRYAPADYEETVNTPGLPRYARQYPFPNGKGRMLEMQTNVLNMCTRPEALQSATL
ncbi:MAG: major capsid protein, partial [Anaerolineae bacterium]|nr:major capsid protein [Anaerolineae bacterium]